MAKRWIAAALVCVLAALIAGSPARAGATLSESEFTAQYASRLTSKVPGITITITEPLRLNVQKPGASEISVFLDNAYKLYRNEPDTLDAILEQYMGMIVNDSGDGNIDRTRIVAIIKDRAWPTEIAKSFSQGKDKSDFGGVIYDDFNGDLVMVYAIDEGQGLKYLQPQDMAQLGISRIELRPTAIENLRRLIPEYRIQRGASVSAIFAGEGYEASLLLFDDLWAGLAVTDGEIVVAVPARDTLMFTTSNNYEGLAHMQRLAKEFAQKSAYRLSDRLYRRRDGRFERFD